MPLTLKRNDQLEANNRFRVLNGKAVVGMLMRVPSGEKQDWWHWSIAGFHVSPSDLGPVAAMSPSRRKPWRTLPSVGEPGWIGRG
jgi:hypothetical protein